MAKLPTLEAKQVNDKQWSVTVPGSMSETGSRQRRYFRDPVDAEKFAASLRNKWAKGLRGSLLSIADSLDADQALSILRPLEMTLTQAAQYVAKQHQSNGSAETFNDRYLNAVREGEERWSSRYSVDMGKVPSWVGSDLMKMRCGLITREILRDAIISCGAKAESTISARLRYALAILNHRPRYRKQSSIEIMSLTQCAQMLRAAENDQERRAVALLLFAGIRPSAEDGEITRVDWDMVGKSEIYLPEEVTKTGSDRHIPITPRLKRLLRGHPDEGPVIPANWKRVYQRLRKAAGLGMEQDITRHTFASHFLAAYDEKATKSAMGHTAGSMTLFKHYRRAVREIDGKAYFGDLSPDERAAKARACKSADMS